MNKNETLLEKAGNVAVGTLVLIWVLNFLFTTRFGAFLMLWFIGGFGSMLVISGSINAFASLFDLDYLAYDQWWLCLLCWGGSALFTLGFMAEQGILTEPVEKKEPDEDDD
jgi:hypothetical protein